MAGLALVAATSGVGYAAGTIGTVDLQDNAVTSPKVADGTLTRADLSASTSSSLGIGKAYALVTRTINSRGVPVFALDAARTQGFVSLTHPGLGTFCLTPTRGLDLAGSAVLTSVEYGQSAGVNASVVWNAATDQTLRSCPAGQVEIITYQNGSDGDADISDDFAFTVLAG